MAGTGADGDAGVADHPKGMYRGLDGAPGSFAAELQVYGRRTTPRGEHVIKELGAHKRAIHYVGTFRRPQRLLRRHGTRGAARG